MRQRMNVTIELMTATDLKFLREAGIAHRSPSQLEMFRRCPNSYYHRYILGEKTPPASAPCTGTSVHHGAEIHYRHKIEHDTDPSERKVVGAAESKWDLLAPTIEDWDAPKGKCKDDVIGMTKGFYKGIACKTKPLLVEQGFRIRLDGIAVPMVGFMDVFDQEQIIGDLKTGKRAKTRDDCVKSLQLPIYGAVAAHVTERKVKKMRLDFVNRQSYKVDRRAQVTWSPRYFERAMYHWVGLEYAIKKGFFPMREDHYLCNDKFCGYFSPCYYQDARMKLQILPALQSHESGDLA